MTERNERRQIIIGVNALGLGQRPSAWQSESLNATSIISAAHWTEVARIAERGALDALFLADAPGFYDSPASRPAGLVEPFTLFAAVASATENLGLIGTASTTFNDPVELARRLQTLDVLSGGRIGWNAVTTQSGPVAGNFGAADVPPRDERYDRAYEFAEAVQDIWASAGSGDVVRHKGSRFPFDATLGLPASAQGHPVLVQAGGSPGGRRIAGEKAEGVFTAELTLDGAIEHYRQVKSLAQAAGRDPREVAILPGFALVIGSTEAEAIRRYDELEAKGPQGYTAERLSGILGEEVGQLDPDSPLPEWITEDSDTARLPFASESFRTTTIRFARENRLTVRELLRRYGGYGHPIIVGTPGTIADTFEHWFRADAADGFTIMPDVFPEGLGHFVDHVVPLLRQRGLFRHEYETQTLRGRLHEAAGIRATRKDNR